MARKKKGDAKEVVLECQVPPAVLIANGENELELIPGNDGDVPGEGAISSGWEWTPSSNLYGVFWEGSIDLSGLMADDRTLFTTAATIQESGPIKTQPAYTFPTPYVPNDFYFVTVDIVSDVPLSKQEVSKAISGITAPGFIGNDITSEWEQIIYGRRTTQVMRQKVIPELNPIDPTAPTIYHVHNNLWCDPVSEYTFGSGAPTASRKLYLYRMVSQQRTVYTFGPGGQIDIPSSRFVIGGFTAKEGDLSHLMRMSRSFEHAQRVE